ncbi:MAG: hypothetical protein WA885_11310 [Phormidesmis sp.]
MSQDSSKDETILTDEVAQNPGARMTATHQNPEVTDEEAQNAVEGKSPNAAGEGVPSTVEDYVKGSDNPEATDLPSANIPRNPEDSYSDKES